MDWKVFASTFGLIFLAELGDKTQLAAFNMVTSTGKPWEVFLGASLSLAVVTGIAVVFGQAVAKVIPPAVIHAVSGVLFVVIGVLMLLKKF